jgi:hypothetical protein
MLDVRSIGEIMRRSVLLASSVIAAAASSAFGVVDFNLGATAPGLYNLTGTTVGASNDIDTYSPSGNPAAIWDQDIIYQFTTSVPVTISFTSNDPDSGTNDNDFWLLTSLATTVNSNGLRAATQLGSSAFINGNYGLQPAGTYYFVIDAWRGNPTSAGTPASGRATAYNVNLSLAVPPPPPAVLFSGALTSSDPTFNRPIAGNPPTILSGTIVHYDVTPVFVTETGSYSFEQGNSPFDDYMFLYSGSFDSTTPLTNVLEGDDDDGAGTNALITRTLTAGVQYFLVNTSFAAGALGAYDVTVINSASGRAVVGLVPEPATLGLLAGLAAFALRRR